jgi:pimeloyl-ACP methyl ester carboxylesterase
VARLARPDGCALHYEVAGDRRSPAIVWLEGLGDHVDGRRGTIENLHTELFVIALDHRGNGRSDPPDEGVTMRTFATDVLALMDEVRVDRAHVYGHSFGGMVAQELALEAPERVRTLILGATHAGGSHVVAVRRKVRKDRPWLALYSERFAEEHAGRVAEDLRVDAEHLQRADAARRQHTAMRSFDAYDRLPWISAPTLVLHGTDDALIDLANASILAERIPNAELALLEGAGHRYASEQGGHADQLVLDFVRRHRDG